MALEKLGAFTFDAIEGDPQHIAEQIDVEQRSGVDGVGLWKAGTRGVPFQITTHRYETGLVRARSAYRNYLTLIGADPVTLVWSGLNLLGRDKTKVAVLAVRPLSIKAIGGAVGTLIPNPGAVCVCEWTLIALDES